MAPTVTITRNTTTATKQQYCGCTTMHAKTSTLDGEDPTLIDVRWTITEYPTGFTYTCDDPRTGHEGGTINLRDGGAFGWNFAVPHTHAGDYTVRCDIIYGAGLIASSTTSFTIAAFTGATRYLDGNASGANDGTSPTDAWETSAAAIAGIKAASGNMRVLVAGSQTYNVDTAATSIAYDNWAIEWDGVGTKPVFEQSPRTAGSWILTQGENITFDGIVIQDSTDDATLTAIIHGSDSFDQSPDHVMMNVEIPLGKKMVNPFSVGSTSPGLFLNNNIMEASGHTGFISAPTCFCVYGGYYGTSDGNRPFRTNAAGASVAFVGVDIYNNVNNREALRFASGVYCSVYACKLQSGAAVLINNTFTGPCTMKYNEMVGIDTFGTGILVDIDAGAASVIGNTIYSDNTSQNNTTCLISGTSDVKFHGNTMKVNGEHSGGTHVFFQSLATPAPSVESNVFRHYESTRANSNTRAVVITGTLPSSFDENVFSFEVGSDNFTYGGVSSNTLATLNGETWASGNTESARTIPLDTFLPSTQDAATIPDGMFFDYYGNETTPGASGFAGAVQSVPGAPTVPNRTPADNATGVSDAQTISMQFSENMAVNNSSASIELRRVSDDSVLDSITAGDATINISDRTQVTLTGLSLSGVTGEVYVYISATAFRASATGIAFAGYLTATDWNFTVGGLTSGNRSRIRDGQRLR